MPISSKRNTATQIAQGVLDATRSSYVQANSVGEFFKYMMDAALETTHTTDSALDALAQLRKKAIAASPVSNSLMEQVNTKIDVVLSTRASAGLLAAAI